MEEQLRTDSPGRPSVLRSQDTATRERKRLDGIWRFGPDPEGVGRTEHRFAGPLPGTWEMAVPASSSSTTQERSPTVITRA
jgi:beta-glucuronidase